MTVYIFLFLLLIVSNIFYIYNLIRLVFAVFSMALLDSNVMRKISGEVFLSWQADGFVFDRTFVAPHEKH